MTCGYPGCTKKVRAAKGPRPKRYCDDPVCVKRRHAEVCRRYHHNLMSLIYRKRML